MRENFQTHMDNGTKVNKAAVQFWLFYFKKERKRRDALSGIKIRDLRRC
jgi:hypothetical protein